MKDETDLWLIERSRQGDRQAFARLVERHYDMIYRIAWKWSGDRTDAEDIAQEVCMKLPAAIRRFEGRSAFTSWLYAITLNAARDLRRMRARQAEGAAVMAMDVDAFAADDPAATLETCEIWRLVRLLSDRQRDCVLLVYAEDLSHAEAAAVLGCAEKTVSWTIHEARKRLKELLEG